MDSGSLLEALGPLRNSLEGPHKEPAHATGNRREEKSNCLYLRRAALALLAVPALLLFIPLPAHGQNNPTISCTGANACVTTYAYDNSRDNVNPNESIFKASTIGANPPQPTSVSTLKGIIYAQPLFLPLMPMGSSTYNVVFVATEENWVYALNADKLATNPILWSANLNNNDGPGPNAGASYDTFASTGNGTFQYTSGSPSAFGMSVVRLHGTANSLSEIGFYTPMAWATLNDGSGTPGNPLGCGGTLLKLPTPSYPTGSTLCTPGDLDLDSGGIVLARATGAANVLPPADNFAVLAGGKEGVFYVLSPSAMKATNGSDTMDPCTSGTGGMTLQCFSPIILPVYDNTTQAMDDTGSRCGPAFWPGNSTNQENILYVAGSRDAEIRGFQMNTTGNGATFNTTQYGYQNPPNPNKAGLIGFPGNCPEVSWNSATGMASDAILWILDTSGYGKAKPAQIFAYSAVPPGGAGQSFGTAVFTDISSCPGAVQFALPTIANGYIFAAGAVQVNGAACTITPCYGQVVAWH